MRALQTTRQGGVSAAPYDSLNLGDHVGDAPLAVERNRILLNTLLPSEPVWLEQVHGTVVANADNASCLPQADACIARHRAAVCVVMTADCLPVLLCDKAGQRRRRGTCRMERPGGRRDRGHRAGDGCRAAAT